MRTRRAYDSVGDERPSLPARESRLRVMRERTTVDIGWLGRFHFALRVRVVKGNVETISVSFCGRVSHGGCEEAVPGPP